MAVAESPTGEFATVSPSPHFCLSKFIPFCYYLGNGYGWYKPLTTCDKWMLSIEILTQTLNGSILYNGPLNKRNQSEDYFSLQLLNGRLLVDLNFGNGQNIRRHLKSSANLADGKWHMIEIRQISTIEHILEILIDYCPLTSLSKQSSECRFMIEFNEDDVFTTNQPLQLGGIALQENANNQQLLPMEYMGNFKGNKSKTLKLFLMKLLFRLPS